MGMYKSQFTEALIAGDKNSCYKIADDYLTSNPSILELYEDIFKKSLYEIGRLWEYNKISVADEHLASAIVNTMLSRYYDNIISDNKLEGKILLSNIEGELHQIGLKMIGDIFEMHSWDVKLLGADTPLPDLKKFIFKYKPDIIGLSVSIYFNFNTLLKYISELRRLFPQINIIIGGQAFNYSGYDIIKKHNVLCLQNTYEVEEFIIKYKTHGQKLFD